MGTTQTILLSVQPDARVADGFGKIVNNMRASFVEPNITTSLDIRKDRLRNARYSKLDDAGDLRKTIREAAGRLGAGQPLIFTIDDHDTSQEK